MIGCTFSRGRVASDTAESGAPSRVAGQFAELLSCAVRSATSDGVQVAAPSDPVSFAVVVYLDPDYASDDGSQPASGVAWDWRASADERYTLQYNKSATRWEFIARHAGTSQTCTLTDTFAAGAAKVLYAAGDASTLYLAADGGTIGTGSARTQQPSGLPGTMDVGSVAAASQFEAAYGAALRCRAPLSQAQWDVLADLASGRPPLLGEAGIGSAMEGLWYGAHAVDWTLPESGAGVDLNDQAAQELILEALNGTGVGPVDHRLVDSPLRDGVVYVDTRGQRRTLGAELFIISRTDRDHLQAIRRTLAAALNPRLGEGVLQYAPADDIYEITAILGEPGAPLDGAVGTLGVRATVPFLCSDSDWRRSVRADDEDEVPAEGLEAPLEIPVELTESAVAFAAVNAGDVPVYPEVVVVAGGDGCTAPAIENVTTGHVFGMRSTFALSAGEVLVIDMDGRTVLLDGVNAMGERDPETEMWALAPGTNELQARVDAGSATVQVRRQSRFVGV